MTDDLISRQAAKDALAKLVPYAICDTSTESYTNGLTDAYNLICQLPSAQPEPTLYGYPIEHLAMIARVMAKEHCTPEDVARLLQNAGEIARMVRDEMMEMLKESIERSCKGAANEDCN